MESPNDDGTNENYTLDLEGRIERLLSEDSELKAKLSAIYTENQELKRRLMLYGNPPTPPSRHTLASRDSNISEKRCAPDDHRGATRIHGGSDKIIHASMDKCPQGHNKLGSPPDRRREQYLMYRHHRR